VPAVFLFFDHSKDTQEVVQIKCSCSYPYLLFTAARRSPPSSNDAMRSLSLHGIRDILSWTNTCHSTLQQKSSDVGRVTVPLLPLRIADEMDTLASSLQNVAINSTLLYIHTVSNNTKQKRDNASKGMENDVSSSTSNQTLISSYRILDILWSERDQCLLLFGPFRLFWFGSREEGQQLTIERSSLLHINENSHANPSMYPPPHYSNTILRIQEQSYLRIQSHVWRGWKSKGRGCYAKWAKK
jgi:hypothetical protein